MSVDERPRRRCLGTASASSPGPDRRVLEAPTLERERVLWSSGHHLVAGLDEVGRGALAGPVVAAACVLPDHLDGIAGVLDSKALTPSQRTRLADEIRRRCVAWSVAAASRREVDRLNVRAASALAMRRALAALPDWDHALYDGLPLRELDPQRSTSVVHGDSLSLSIACASILAKVTRDALMTRLAARHPEYGWQRNVGYGTDEHLAALRAHGPTAFHRTTFAPVRTLVAPERATEK
ncbi:MAG TPA: ribonuclease HII [Thermomicrobiaceae bacterium]|nr:ribonuclease HII [Thermomicrobiaceae bacterium]